MARMKEINVRIADLQQQWGDLLPDATNNAAVWVDNKEDLAGLSEADIAQCKNDAENRGGKAPYCIVIVNTTQQALLTNLENRDLRRKVFEASIHRADGTNKFNTFPLVVEIAKLRAEQAEIMGYKNYASYTLENKMAKTPEKSHRGICPKDDGSRLQAGAVRPFLLFGQDETRDAWVVRRRH